MIQADRGDDAHLGRDDVRGVEPSAHAHFDHRNVARLPRKLQERHRRHELEKTRMLVGVCVADPLGDRPEFAHVVDDLLLLQNLPIHLHAFAELHEMRRGVESRTPAGRPQNRFQHRRHRAFAVRARYVQTPHRPFRMRQRRGQRVHPIDAELHPARLQAEKVLCHRRVLGRNVGAIHWTVSGARRGGH
jgi:hypothetical protein